MSSTLAASPTDRSLWERFQSGRCSDQEVASNVVLQRWKRCQEAGLSADRPGEPVMALEGIEEAIDAYGPLLAPGAPFDAFATTMALGGYCGVFSNDSCVVLARRIAEPFLSTVAETRLVVGAVWSEQARGTNGLGTTLVEGHPTSVVGTEHYELRNHGLACYAAPVRDIRRRVVGVLDASGPVSVAAGFVQASVSATAAALEALIVARTYDAAVPGGLFQLERLLASLPHATLLLEVTGHVRRANARFNALAGGAGAAPLMRAAFPHLATNAPSGMVVSDSSLETFRGRAIELEPIGEPDDPFAAIVHLRPRRTRPAPTVQRLPEAFAPIVASDPAMVATLGQAARFAPTDLAVLLLAETGAGKELFARAIHNASTRSRSPFVAVNCGALTGTLLESELFGYGPGAFTGASPAGRIGKLAAAHEGTLFLDEVAEMSPPAQSTLLRFLEDGTFYRVGEAVERHADVRLVAATSRDLPALVADGRFRSDLYFRMRGVVLRLPPLRERSDRRHLALALLERVARARGTPKPLGLSRAALDWIERHDWPGNVRELRTALEYAVVLAGDAPRIELWHLPLDETREPDEPRDLRFNAERAALLHALERSGGNLSSAAKALGVARSTLYRMLTRHELRPEGAAAED